MRAYQPTQYKVCHLNGIANPTNIQAEMLGYFLSVFSKTLLNYNFKLSHIRYKRIKFDGIEKIVLGIKENFLIFNILYSN